jgi:hypothetical protein
MSETEKLTVGALLTVLLAFVPGFILHEAPRFPGSLAGSLLGIAGATLMVLTLVYPLVKHVAWLRQRVTSRVPLRAVLSFHVYAGVFGALLGILHTGHKFRSPLGIALVASMLVVVLSGFIGRYYIAHLRMDLRDQKAMLETLRAEYDRVATKLAGAPAARSLSGFIRTSVERVLHPATAGTMVEPAAVPIPELVNAIADLEYAMRQREAIQRAFMAGMVAHVSASIVMYTALTLHVWNGIYYGLRWLG